MLLSISSGLLKNLGGPLKSNGTKNNIIEVHHKMPSLSLTHTDHFQAKGIVQRKLTGVETRLKR
jgi:hypothetical protein